MNHRCKRIQDAPHSETHDQIYYILSVEQLGIRIVHDEQCHIPHTSLERISWPDSAPSAACGIRVDFDYTLSFTRIVYLVWVEGYAILLPSMVLVG